MSDQPSSLFEKLDAWRICLERDIKAAKAYLEELDKQFKAVRERIDADEFRLRHLEALTGPDWVAPPF